MMSDVLGGRLGTEVQSEVQILKEMVNWHSRLRHAKASSRWTKNMGQADFTMVTFL